MYSEIDTRSTQPLLEDQFVPRLDDGMPTEQNPEPNPTPPPPVDHPDLEQGWYYQAGNNTIGPLSLLQVHSFIQEGKIVSTTYVWHKSMPDWMRASTVVELNFGEQT